MSRQGRTLLPVVVAVVAAGVAAAAAGRWSFDQDHVAKIAAGWANVSGTWLVLANADAPSQPYVLAQVSRQHTGGHFNVAVAEQFRATDVDISVRFRSVSGKEDRGGGPVWRYQDAKNYYVARFNPLEDNYRVYKVVNGRRVQLGSANAILSPKGWHRIRVTMVGQRIRCYLNNRKLLEVEDGTFKSAGRIGLWTKADAVTFFDDLRATGK